MKDHRDYYVLLLLLIFCIIIEQCEQSDALQGIEHELELLNINQQ